MASPAGWPCRQGPRASRPSRKPRPCPDSTAALGGCADGPELSVTWRPRGGCMRRGTRCAAGSVLGLHDDLACVAGDDTRDPAAVDLELVLRRVTRQAALDQVVAVVELSPSDTVSTAKSPPKVKSEAPRAEWVGHARGGRRHHRPLAGSLVWYGGNRAAYPPWGRASTSRVPPATWGHVTSKGSDPVLRNGSTPEPGLGVSALARSSKSKLNTGNRRLTTVWRGRGTASVRRVGADEFAEPHPATPRHCHKNPCGHRARRTGRHDQCPDGAKSAHGGANARAAVTPMPRA